MAPRRGVLSSHCIFVILLLAQFSTGCDHDKCTVAYRSEKKTDYVQNCGPLYRYRECLEAQTEQCKGILKYHTELKVAQTWYKTRCQSDSDDTSHNQTNIAQEVDMYMSDPCEYNNGNSTSSHCVLFGDPHLKTFKGEFMTCRIQKAWPLLSNPFMAVQVTNELVSPDHKATATTKVTVIIKSHSECGGEKTYEASSEALPKAFMDGSTYSGGPKSPQAVIIYEDIPGDYVRIFIKYINATIGIRKIGRYLTVSATLPTEILEDPEGGQDMQLCNEGCPPTERLHPTVGDKTNKAMSQEMALKLCREYNMTDYYLDSCVFDLVTTGDKSFIQAARAAHVDLWKHVPKTAYLTLLNCTKWPCQVGYYSSSGVISSDKLLINSMFVFIVYFMYIINLR